MLLRLADRVWHLSGCFVELFKNVEQLNAVLLLLLFLKIYLMILVETFFPLTSILELTLRVLPRLLWLELIRINLSYRSFRIAK